MKLGDDGDGFAEFEQCCCGNDDDGDAEPACPCDLFLEDEQADE